MEARTLAAVAICAVLTAACVDRTPDSVEGERDRLEERQDAFLAGLAARDAERTTALFAEDAALHIANMPPVRGRDAIREFYANVFRFMTASEATPETLRMSSGADMAYSVGRASNTFQSEEGPVEYTGKYLLVWEKRANEWQVVVYSISNNQPEGAP